MKLFEKYRRKLAEPYIPKVHASTINKVIDDALEDHESDKNILFLIGANIICDEAIHLDSKKFQWVVANCNFGGLAE